MKENIFKILEKRGIRKKKLEEELKNREKIAEEILRDSSKFEQLRKAVIKKYDQFSSMPIVGKAFEDVKWLYMLISDYKKGNYKDIPFATIVTIVGSFIYLTSPVDIIPDFLPVVGLFDDVALISITIQAVSSDLDRYKEWKMLESRIDNQKD